MKFLTPIDMTQKEVQNLRLHTLATSPGAPVEGQIYYDSSGALKTPLVWNGTAWTKLGLVQSVSGAGAISASVTDGVLSISISAASGSAAGSMSSSHYTMLATATEANSASTLVLRDASGNFAAGTISANLSGNATTATTATNLGSVGQNAAYILNRGNHTGTQLSATISDLATTVKAYKLNEFAVPTASVAMNGQKITGLADPTNPQDAATKAYVDSTRVGLDWKESVRVATTANIANLATGAPDTVDEIPLVINDRVLVKSQTDAEENGIYIVQVVGTGANGQWARALDADTSTDVSPGMFTFVEDGTLNADSGWVLSTNAPITLGVTELTFTQYSQAGSVDAINVGTGGVGVYKQKVGGTLQFKKIQAGSNQVTITDNTLNSQVDIDIAPANIDKNALGGSALAVNKGGTGATDAATARTNLGVTGGRKVASSIGDGVALAYAITHNMGTRDVAVSLAQTASPYAMVIADVEMTDINTVTVRFAAPAPTTNQYRVVVIG